MVIDGALSIPDHEYWRSQINCQAACPVHTDARGYVRAIADGDFERAYLIARGPNPLASICGRVCGAPCEQSCRRGEFDKPIAIRALKRFVCSRFGPETRDSGGRGLIDYLKASSRRAAELQCQGEEELLPLLQATLDRRVPLVDGRSVGIIGSGPAGLAAAHDLAILGFAVTIYEMEPVLAGMLAVGIPEYRLPRALIRAEVEVILELGVEAVTSCQVGKDITFDELRRRHDAVVVCVGAKRSRELPLPGADADGVIGGVEFLRDVSLGEPPVLGRRVVVIGGGNVAYDVGRTVVRQTSIDAARAALRSDPEGVVYLCSLESLDEMPADDVEIAEGEEEGIVRRNGVGPTAILQDEQGRVTGVTFRRCLRVYDENRRFSPVFDDEAVETIDCDNVLVAVGQSVDLSFIDRDRDRLDVDERGLLRCDPITGATAAADVFVAGDLAYGPKLLIHAVASGKRVARTIYTTFTGREIGRESVELHLALPEYAREKDYERRARVALPVASAEARRRSQSTQVELELSPHDARLEAARCLDCGVNTIFDGSRCILCGGCVDVCPSLCLRIVSLSRIADDPAVGSICDRQLGGSAAADASAIIKDETICIRCGLCAERCPTGAITMERFLFKEVPACQGV
jgi:NADPH-dependent glutamate synthase beta subunit-like oxidoreductase/ferredoxin